MMQAIFKSVLVLMLSLITGSTMITASAENVVIQTIMDAGTTQAFTQDAVAEEDLNAILEAGLSATSAINQQPWYFAVVSNQDVMAEINGMKDLEISLDDENFTEYEESTEAVSLGDSPVAIICYMDLSTMSPNTSFDCGLACQNMVIAANALGYGAKVVSSPVSTLNGENHDYLCDILGVDTSMNAVSVLLIGHEDSEVNMAANAYYHSSITEKVSFTD